MHFLDYDGKVMTFLNTFWNIVWINLLWLVCCIPVFTIGTSTTAAYHTMQKCVRMNSGYVTKEFFRSFKKNFKHGTVLTFIFGALGIFLAVDCYFFYNSDMEYALAGLWFSYFLVALLLAVMNWAFPWLARFELTALQVVKTSLSLSFLHLAYSVAFLLVDLVLAAGLFCCPWGFLLFPGVKCFIDTFIFNSIVKKYLPKEEKKDELNEWRVQLEDKDELSQ